MAMTNLSVLPGGLRRSGQRGLHVRVQAQHLINADQAQDMENGGGRENDSEFGTCANRAIVCEDQLAYPGRIAVLSRAHVCDDYRDTGPEGGFELLPHGLAASDVDLVRQRDDPGQRQWRNGRGLAMIGLSHSYSSCHLTRGN
jgi:hypothetical protein